MTAWKRLWRRRSREADLDAELRFHLQRQLDDYLRAGLSPKEARRRVSLEFGSLDLAKDECRDVRPLQWLDTLGRDIRLGFRALNRERFFAASVIAHSRLRHRRHCDDVQRVEWRRPSAVAVRAPK